MSSNQPLDFNKEFSLLTQLVFNTWLISDRTAFMAAAKEAFNQGLNDGRLWIDNHINYRVGKYINGNDEMDPLAGRKSQTEDSRTLRLYDGINYFSMNIRTAVDKIYDAHFRPGTFDYSEQAEHLVKRIQFKFFELLVEPVKIAGSEQKAFIDGYAGYRATSVGAPSTPGRISYADAVYGKEEQSRSFYYTLFSVIYSHGLKCAQEQNDRSLVRTLGSIYIEHRDEPLSDTSGPVLLDKARANELTAVFEAVSPFKFPKVPKDAPQEVDSSPETIELRRQRAQALVRNIAKRVNSDEEKARRNEDLKKVSSTLESFRDKLTVYAI